LAVHRHRGHGLVEVGIERLADALDGLGPRLARGGEEKAVRRGDAVIEVAVRRAGGERPLERVQHGQQREQRRAAALAPRGLVLLRGPAAVVVELREEPEMPIIGFGGALAHAFLSSASLNSASMTSPSCPPPAAPCGPAPGSVGPPREAASASICDTRVRLSWALRMRWASSPFTASRASLSACSITVGSGPACDCRAPAAARPAARGRRPRSGCRWPS